MLESGIELLRTILFASTKGGTTLSMYKDKREARVKAAAALGRIGTATCISILRDYIEFGDLDHEVLPEAIDAFGWALEMVRTKNDERNLGQGMTNLYSWQEKT